MTIRRNPTRILMIVYILLMLLLSWNNKFLWGKGVDVNVLSYANTILFIMTVVTFYLGRSSIKSPNPNVFVRSVYLGFLIKFFALAIIAFVYILTQRKAVNKPAIIGAALLYIVYSVFETRALLKELKLQKNG